MAVGASFADLAVLLVHGQKGMTRQTRRHARICSMMGIRHMLLAVNKMDLVDYSEEMFRGILSAFREECKDHRFSTLEGIPVSATKGDNLTEKSMRTGWYEGPCLLEYLETINVREQERESGLILPVQRVCRPNHQFRGFQGTVEQGEICPGEEVSILPSGETARVRGIHVMDRKSERALPGQPVTLELDREVDISRGSVIAGGNTAKVADSFMADLLWLDDTPLIPGRSYHLKCGTSTLPAMVMRIHHRINMDSGMEETAESLVKNEIAFCDMALCGKMVFQDFSEGKALGGFILIDRLSHRTSGCGMIRHSSKSADTIVPQETEITRAIRSGQKSQRPRTLWFTGLPGSGKTTLANQVEKRLVALGKHTMMLDGDLIRHGLNRNLGFSEADRVENIRRVAEVAKLMNDAGLIVLASFISPYAADRQNARDIIGEGYMEIYVSTPLEVCEQRDPKELYKKARRGEIAGFTGVSSPYEAPLHPEIAVDTSTCTAEEAVDAILGKFHGLL